MLKRIRLFAISLSLVFVLSGCAAAGMKTSEAPAGMTASDQAAVETTSAAKSDQESPETAADNDGSSVIIDPGNVADSGKKIIYTVSMSLEAAGAAQAIDEIGKKVSEIGGYVSDSSFSQYDNTASGSIVVRIPPDKLNEFTKHIGSKYKVLTSSMGSQDVTDQYVDAQSRLKNAQAQESQLLSIMAKAFSIEDILKVRIELNSVQQEIEVLKGQIRLMDNLVGYSTVSITITEPAPPPESPEIDENSGLLARWSFDYIWQSVQKGFANSLSFTVNALGFIFIALSYLIIPAIGIAIVVLLIFFLVRRSRKKKARNVKAK